LAKDYLEADLLAAARQLADRVVSETDAGQVPYVGAADVLGRLALRAEDNQSALQWYRQLTKLRRVSGDFFLLGLCESNAGNVDAAIEAFEQALRIDPTLVPAHEHLARVLQDSGNTHRARLHQQAIRSLRSRAGSGVNQR
jgi:tetratricopeptide (TPR) repeat protein